MAEKDSKDIAKEIIKLLKDGLQEEQSSFQRREQTDATDAKIQAATEAQEALNESLREESRLQAEIADLRRDNNQNILLSIELEEKKAELVDAETEQERNILRQKIRDLENAIDSDVAGNLRDQIDLRDQLIIKIQEQTEAEKKLRDEAEQAKLEDYNESIEELAAKGFPTVIKSAQNTRKKIGSLGKDLTTIGKDFERMGGMTGKFGKGLSHVGGKLTKLQENLTGANLVLFALAKELFNMGVALDKASKDLGAATGFGDVFSSQLLSIQKSGNMAGIGIGEASEALGALANGLSSFNPKAEETNAHVALTVARMKKLGVASASSVKSIEHMERSMGLSAKQAANATANIAMMGKEIGVTGTKMINDFNAASGRLAIFGKDNIKMFKQLAAAAKASGIEMQTLIGISKKFDDFSGAADSISQLNAVLGTNLSTMEMMGASDAERVMMIRQQVKMSVGNFDSLDKYTKMYVAQAMGVSDVAEAQKLLNMSQSEYMKNQAKQKEQADVQAEMAKNTEQLQQVMDQAKAAATEFFLMFSPIISGVASLLSLLSKIGPALGYVAKGVAVLTIAWLALNIQAGLFAGIMTAIGWTLLIAGILLVVGAIGFLVDAFFSLLGTLKMNFNPDLGQVFHFLADGLMLMLTPLKFVGEGISKLTGKFASLFGVAKKDAADVINKDGFNLKAMADIDTEKLSSGISKVKAALIELSNIELDGFLALRTDGTSTSVFMGSEDVITSLNKGKLEVEVKMPKITMPDINVKVFIGNRELKDIIRTEVHETLGRAS